MTKNEFITTKTEQDFFNYLKINNIFEIDEAV